MKLVFASNNANKIKEIKALLPPAIEILSLQDIGCLEEIPETAATIEGNAQLKADYVTQKYGYDCFADDSGLEVDHLNGRPGVHSARFAGEPRDDGRNLSKLLESLSGVKDRGAQFKTVIALNIAGEQHLFTGTIRGVITNEKSGTGGFGYDPVFRPEGYQTTFAEMPLEEKSAISHRGLAVRQLVAFLK